MGVFWHRPSRPDHISRSAVRAALRAPTRRLTVAPALSGARRQSVFHCESPIVGGPPLRSHAASVPEPVSFAHDIRPLFRSLDIASMLPYDVLLGDYEYMSDATDDHRHARDVGDFL